MSPEKALWRAVIVQALDDAFPTSVTTDLIMLRNIELEQQRARSWFHTNDFREVCSLADTQPHTIMREYDRRRVACPA